MDNELQLACLQKYNKPTRRERGGSVLYHPIIQGDAPDLGCFYPKLLSTVIFKAKFCNWGLDFAIHSGNGQVSDTYRFFYLFFFCSTNIGQQAHMQFGIKSQKPKTLWE